MRWRVGALLPRHIPSPLLWVQIRGTSTCESRSMVYANALGRGSFIQGVGHSIVSASNAITSSETRHLHECLPCVAFGFYRKPPPRFSLAASPPLRVALYAHLAGVRSQLFSERRVAQAAGAGAGVGLLCQTAGGAWTGPRRGAPQHHRRPARTRQQSLRPRP